MTRTAERYVGQSLPRKEDAALLTGRGTWTDDITPAGTLHLAVLRSPLAARADRRGRHRGRPAHPGVVGRPTGEDLAGEFATGIPCGWPVTEDIKIPDHRPLAADEVNHVGDGVAVVLAVDAAHRAGRAGPGRGRLRGAARGRRRRGGAGTGRPARARGAGHQPLLHLAAGHRRRRRGLRARPTSWSQGRYLQQRVLASPMEPRAVVVTPDPVGGGVHRSTPPPRCRTSCATSWPRSSRDVGHQAARGRPGRRRRVRRQAQRLRRGGARARAGPPARASR